MNEKEIEKNTINSAEIVESSVDEKEIFNLNNEIVYHISDFDGPLDLLVTLIHDNEIDIEDLFISEITSQYVQIIKSTPREELDYDYAGEFIRTAAELLALKSARSLPRDDDEELDEDDPEYLRQQYILKVKEYALMKEQADKMRDIETINRFYREPEYDEHDYRIALVDFSLDKLIEAYAKICVQFDIAQRQ